MELDTKYDHYDYPTTAPVAKPGHPGHLTDAQQAQVHQLRMMLESEGYTKRLDTLTLLRFLRARKFDVNLSKKMFVDCEKWRKTILYAGQPLKIDGRTIDLDEEISEWDQDGSFKRKVSKWYPQYYHKTDKDGRPVYIEQLGKIDLGAMKNEGIEYEHMLTNLAVEYEKMADPRLPACSRKAGHLLETSCTIMDFNGVGFSNARQVFGYIQEASGMSQNYYPERLGRMYLINTNWLFTGVWRMVRPLLDPVTVEKIHVLGGNYQKDLLAQIPAENLPKEFGGSCQCEGGCPLSNAGPWCDAEFAKPAWWEKKGGDAIENTPTEIGTGEGAAATTGTTAPEGAEATVPAPAIA
ncbi:CRAL-TRIO domain-containing protein [Hypoxylon rubiginosum]|uniref:CRAL-TRIO domain-containing protein n=1 Tax=Hypoxylon rubiginosum TaxID=110542 RepID=A0ACB9YXF2_9PEZI|nr:CRAL-TRIO domain-containing protein [Hypoxylon rubiginosum]